VPELVGLLNKAKLSGKPMTIVIDEGGYAREEETERRNLHAGMVTIVDRRPAAVAPCSRCVSGMEADGKRIDFEALDDQPVIEPGTPEGDRVRGTVGSLRKKAFQPEPGTPKWWQLGGSPIDTHEAVQKPQT
jgi:hypothetical protein